MDVAKIIAAIPDMPEDRRAQLRINAQRARDVGAPAEKVAAAEQLLSALDSQIGNEQDSFVARVRGMTLAERVADAFTEVPPTPVEKRAIKALVSHPGKTAAELSAQSASTGKIWHRWFAALCKKRRQYFWPDEDVEKRESQFYAAALADLDEETGTYTMKPGAAEGFASIGIKG